MAQQDNFIFEIGGNIDGFKKTISQVEAELKRVKGSLKDQLGQGLVDANRYINELEGSITNLKKVGLDKLPQSSYAGAAALNSISQVARDLPFGFVAIQNNLPIVLDQFSALSKTSGGLFGALKAVGTSLIGPAGLSFAFGAIIAGVTSLTQKYGSLGEAFRNVFGLVTEAEKLQKSYNKELIDGASSATAESGKIDILVNSLKDSKKPFSERIAAYRELKTIAPDVVAGIRDENALTQESINLIGEQAKQRRALILLKAQEQALNKVIGEVTNKQLTLEIERAGLIANLTQAQDAYNRAKKQGIIDAAQAEGFQAVEVITLRNAENALKANITAYNQTISTTDEYLKKLEPLINSIAQYNSKVYDSEEALKRFRKQQAEAAKEVALWTGFAASASFAGDDFNKVVRDNEKNLANLTPIIERVAQATWDVQGAIDGATNTLSANPNFQMDKIFGAAFERDTISRILQTTDKTDAAFKAIKDRTNELNKEIKRNFSNVASIVESSLVQPLTYLFDTVLSKGKISWKEFGNIVIDQLKRILIQIIATAAAAGIANAIVPGSGSAALALASSRGQGTGFFGSKQSSVNFGGLNPAGLAMSGSVALSLRGSDLIGAINRTNTNINRIG